MGSRGASLKANTKAKIIDIRDFRSTDTGSSKGKWDFRGISEAINKLTDAYNKAKNKNDITKVYKAINEQEKVIQSAIDNIDNKVEDVSSLYTQRRKLRQLKDRLLREQKY